MRPARKGNIAPPLLSIILLAMSLSLPACDLVPDYATATFACESDVMCAEGFVCGASGVCEKPCTGADCNTCTSDEACEWDETCTEAKTCEPLVADLSCGDIIGSSSDNALQLGLIFTLTGPFAQSGLDQRKAVELAVSEINAGGGVQGLQGQRELAFVVCDDKGREDHVLAATEYMNRRGIPAVVGPLFSRLLEVAATQVGIEKGLFMLSPSSTAQKIRDLDDNNLVWRVSSTDAKQADALAYFALWLALEDLYEGATTIRVLAVHTDDNYGSGFQTTFSAALSAYQTLLQATAGDNPLGVEFSAISYTPKSETDDWALEISTTMAAIQNKAPHIMLFVGYEDTADLLLKVKQDPVLKTRPLLLTDGVSSPGLATTYNSEDELPPHVFGTHPGIRAGTSWEHFAANYGTSNAAGTLPAWTEYTYDAVYLLAYASASMAPEDMTGGKFAEAFTRFNDPTGRGVNVGPTHLVVAAQDMGAGLSIDVRGASGPLDFDLATGEPESVGIVRWTLDFPKEGDPGAVFDCGLAMFYASQSSTPNTYWCNALCALPPSDTPSCQEGVCEADDAICVEGRCTGGDDCKPDTLP